MKHVLTCALLFVGAASVAAQSVGQAARQAPSGDAKQAAPLLAPSSTAANTAAPARQPAPPDVYPAGRGAGWGSGGTGWYGGSGSGWSGTAHGFGAGVDTDLHTWATTAHGTGFNDGRGGAGTAGYGGGAYGGALTGYTPARALVSLAGADSTLLDQVRSSLATDPAFRSLQAEVVGGVVFLRGGLSDPAAGDRAVSAARSVPGVRGVILRVSRPGL